MPRLEISPETAARVGRRVWLNETGGKADAITAWNAAENFPSLGIGHFIWFPAGHDEPFEESFPPMLEFIRRQGVKLPEWLDRTPIPPSPWRTRAQFEADFRGPRLTELRELLTSTFGPQTQYLVLRARHALPRILRTLDKPGEREHVRRQFTRIVRSSPDLYPLIDYINFKGEGTRPTEVSRNPVTGAEEGWGLKHVLIEMRGTAEGRSALEEFAEAAKTVLRRRIANNPPSKRWEAGWMARCDTYRQPLP